MKLKRLFLLFLCIVATIFAVKAQTLSRDSLVLEFKHYIKLLEETHPDPYIEYGGKVAFHKLAFEKEQLLKSKDFTLGQYRDLLQSFIAEMHDGHTSIYSPSTMATPRYIKLTIKTIGDGIIVSGLPTSQSKYLGSRIMAIDGMPIDTLCQKITKITSSENIYGTYLALESICRKPSRLAQLIPSVKDRDFILIKIETPEGKAEELSIPISEDKDWNTHDFTQLPDKSSLATNEYLSYQHIKDRHAMYLRMKSVMSRECFLEMQKQNMPVKEQLESFYQYTLRRKMPENIDTAIAQIPCYAELFKSMLLEMKKSNTPNLIIDLRNNGGGWTPIVLPSLYMLFGDAYIGKDMEVQFYKMISPLFLKKFASTLDELNKNFETSYQFGDYTFDTAPWSATPLDTRRKNFIENTIGNVSSYISDLNGEPIYRPAKIYVITNASTFSAAFHYAFYLWKMGATVVGVPSAQAPNTFMEATEFELPYTQTKGAISNCLQVFLPTNDKRAKIFWPELATSYKDYKRYSFDQDAEALWLLDYLKTKPRK